MITVQGDKNPEYFGNINSLYRKEYYQALKITLHAELPTEEACDMARAIVSINVNHDKKITTNHNNVVRRNPKTGRWDYGYHE